MRRQTFLVVRKGSKHTGNKIRGLAADGLKGEIRRVKHAGLRNGIGSGDNKLEMYFVRQGGQHLLDGAEGVRADLSEARLGGA